MVPPRLTIWPMDYKGLSEEEVIVSNENLMNMLNINHENTPRDPEGKVTVLSSSQVRKIYRATERTRVVQREYIYDPDEEYGFCYGRALIAHYNSMVRNIHPSAIKKVWVVGDMKKWSFHVATMLKVKEGWRVIDTYTGLLTLERWVKRLRRDKKKKAKELMFFVTSPTRFGYFNNTRYNSIDLFNVSSENYDKYNDKETTKESTRELKEEDYYNGFFIDFFQEFDRRSEKIKPFKMKR